MMRRLPQHRNGTRQHIAAAEGLIGVDGGGQLLPFGIDQDHSRVPKVALGQEHFDVFGTRILKELVGTIDRCAI